MKYNGIDFDTYFKNYPDQNGFFGKYGGAFVSDELKKAMEEITESYFTICKSSKFACFNNNFSAGKCGFKNLFHFNSSIYNILLWTELALIYTALKKLHI